MPTSERAVVEAAPSIRGGFKRNAIWAVAGTVATVSSQVVTIVVLARLLSPFEFGIVSIATLINQFALIFVEFGVGPCIVQRSSLGEKTIGTAYFISCLLGLTIAAIIVIVAPFVSNFLDVPELTQVLRIYSIMFLLFGACAVHEALTQRALEYPYLARADATSFAVGYAGVSIGCALMGFSYWSMVVGHICQLAIRCVFLRNRHKNLARYPVDWKDVRLISNFGFGQTLSRLGSFIASQADGFVVSSRLGVTTMGNYGRANQLVTMPAAQLGQIFDKLIFPYVSRLKDERERTAATYLNAVSAICILSMPASAVIWIYGENIVNLLLGEQWAAVVEPLQILALAIPFRLIHKVSDPTARAMGKTYSRAWRQWVVAVSLICFSLVLSQHGLAAVAWGVVAVAAIDAALMVWLCLKVMGFRISEFCDAIAWGVYAGLAVFVVTGAVTQLPTISELNDFILLASVSMICVAIVSIFLRNFVKVLR